YEEGWDGPRAEDRRRPAHAGARRGTLRDDHGRGGVARAGPASGGAGAVRAGAARRRARRAGLHLGGRAARRRRLAGRVPAGDMTATVQSGAVPGAGPAAAHRTRGVPRAVPPAGIPLTFLAAAGAGLVAFGAAIAAVAPTAVTAPNAPEPIGAVHLGMLAFLSTAVLGAMHQFAPVASERPLRSPRVAYATAVVWIPTVWVLASGFASGHPAVVSAGGVAASVAIALAAWNLSAPLSARGKGTPVAGLRIALTFLVITAGFGVTYAFDRHTGWFALFPRRVLAHAHLGLLGWLGVAYVAVAEKLWPMFLLAHRPGARSGAWAIRLLPAGALVLAAGVLLPSPPLAVAGGVLVAGGLAAHLTSLAGLLRHRRRSLELLHAFILSSAASLVVAAVAGTVAGLAPVSTTWRV